MANDGEFKVWVGGLPSDINDQELKEAFSTSGRVVDLSIRHSKNDTFAFVSFEDERGQEAAMKAMDQSSIFGRPIKVNFVIKDGVKGGKDGKGKGDRKGGKGDRDDRDRGDDRWGGGRYDDGGRKDDGWRSRDGGKGDGWRDDRGGGRGSGYDDRGGGDRYRDRGDGFVKNQSSRGDRGGQNDFYDDRGRNRDDDRGGGRRGDDRGKRDDYNDGGDYRSGKGSKGRGKGDDRGRDRSSGRYRGDDRGRDDDRPIERNRPPPRDDKGKGRGGKGQSASDAEANQSRVWIGGLPKDITEREVEKEFSKFGPILEEVRVKHSDRDTFAFVQYGRTSHARDAIAQMTQSNCFGGVIKVSSANDSGSGKGKGKDDHSGGGKGGGSGGGDRARSRSPRPRGGASPRRDAGRSPRRDTGRSPPRRDGGRPPLVMLENLPSDMKQEELHDVGSDFGHVVRSRLWEQGDVKHGFLEYQRRSEVQNAIGELDGRRMQGWARRLKAYIKD